MKFKIFNSFYFFSTFSTFFQIRNKIIHDHRFVDNEDISQYKEKQLSLFRRNSIGFVFQFYNLIGNLTALDNVEIASEICKNPMDASKVLTGVELQDRMNSFPSQLSGKEQKSFTTYGSLINILKGIVALLFFISSLLAIIVIYNLRHQYA